MFIVWGIRSIDLVGTKMERDVIRPEAAGQMSFLGTASFLQGNQESMFVDHGQVPSLLRSAGRDHSFAVYHLLLMGLAIDG